MLKCSLFGGIVEMSKEIILEAGRFEAKLREMFGFSAQVSRIKSLFLGP
jgi:hypothetical protein